jgi:hypothetical protein
MDDQPTPSDQSIADPSVLPNPDSAGLAPDAIPVVVDDHRDNRVYPVTLTEASELDILQDRRKRLQIMIQFKERRLVIIRQVLVIIFLVGTTVWFFTYSALLQMLQRALGPGSTYLFLSLTPIAQILVIWFYHAIVCFVIGYLAGVPIKLVRDELAEVDEQIRVVRTREPEGRLDYLQEKIQRLTHAIARVFLDNQVGSDLANKWREQADHILEELRQPERTDSMDMSMPPKIGQAESLISQINELILREENELRQQRNWQWIAIGIMLFYIVLLVSVILIFPEAAASDQSLPVFGIPLSVVMWGATGSLGAILYRFYTERDRVRFDIEVRWLIARPIIGIIMGGLAYLAIATGLLLLNRTTDASALLATNQTPGRMEAYWIFAFLAGFSDKFYRRIINLLVDKTIGEDEPDKEEPPGEEMPSTSGDIKLKSIAKAKNGKTTKAI